MKAGSADILQVLSQQIGDNQAGGRFTTNTVFQQKLMI